MSLTNLQRETLETIALGKVSQVNHGYGAWRTVGASPTVVGRLMSLGLAKWPTRSMGGVAVLTEAGEQARAAITRADGGGALRASAAEGAGHE